MTRPVDTFTYGVEMKEILYFLEIVPALCLSMVGAGGEVILYNSRESQQEFLLRREGYPFAALGGFARLVKSRVL